MRRYMVKACLNAEYLLGSDLYPRQIWKDLYFKPYKLKYNTYQSR